MLLYALSWLAELDLRGGQWASAYARSAEALRLTEGLGQGAALTFALVGQARVEALLGHDQDCRAHLDAALQVAARDGVGAARPHAEAVLGRLELSRSRVAEAVDHLEAAAWIAEEQGTFDGAIHGWPPRPRRGLRPGRPRRRGGRAARPLRRHRRARRAGLGARRGRPLPRPARARGCLRRAVPARRSRCTRPRGCRSTWPAPSSATASGCGASAAGSRPASSSARRIEAFDRLGAAAFAERARTELAATGQTARRGEAALSGTLTGQELQVALIVAKGATNREAAVALYLSPKTIEYHLRSVYRKLGIRSRVALARVVAREAELGSGRFGEQTTATEAV